MRKGPLMSRSELERNLGDPSSEQVEIQLRPDRVHIFYSGQFMLGHSLLVREVLWRPRGASGISGGGDGTR